MKKHTYILFNFYNLTEANSQDNSNIYGDNFSSKNVEDFTFIKSDFPEKIEMPIKIKGKYYQPVLRKVADESKSEEDTILVRFKDYGFFVPKQESREKKL